MEATSRGGVEKAAPDLMIDHAALKATKVPPMEKVGEVDAKFLGWGGSPPENLRLRKLIKGEEPRPNPWAGMGIFVPPEGYHDLLKTQEDVRKIKLGEILKLDLRDDSSFLFIGHQPLVSMDKEKIVATELLLRCRNGSDCAPYEDIVAITAASASEDEKLAYAHLMAFQGVDEVLMASQKAPLNNLDHIIVNYDKEALSPSSATFALVSAKIAKLPPESKELLVQKKVLEIVEDKPISEQLFEDMKKWEDIGFTRRNFSIDDMIGDKASAVLAKTGGPNFHTISACKQLLEKVRYAKVDMHWAKLIFLTHPAWRVPEKNAAILEAARNNRIEIDGIPSTEITYDELVDEFASFCLSCIEAGREIGIELTILPENPNNAFGIEKVLARGLDLLGKHAPFFAMQGGHTEAKAFQSSVLAANVQLSGTE